MACITDKLIAKKIIAPPYFVKNSIQYEVLMGSSAYGVSSNSDTDVYGFCMPPKDMIFPHIAGYIIGFGKKPQGFDQYQQHHIKSENKEYDICIYNIVKYFQLCMQNNPNMIDSLFVPQRCIMHSTKIGNIVRERRKDFLHKGCYHRFRGYAYSQMHKIKTKNPDDNSKRHPVVIKYGYDVKFAYHVVRLLLECEQILIEHDIDLERNREMLKSIRRGEWSLEKIEDLFNQKERHLDDLYHNCDLPYSANEDEIKKILINCIEEYYGSIDIIYKKQDIKIIDDLRNLLLKYNN